MVDLSPDKQVFININSKTLFTQQTDKMIFNIEVKNGQIINIDGCSDTKELAAKWEQNIPQQWPNKSIECHFALKMAIEAKTKPDNWCASIITGGYNYCLADNTIPATREYVEAIGEKLAETYTKWKNLVKVPEVMPDNVYKFYTILV